MSTQLHAHTQPSSCDGDKHLFLKPDPPLCAYFSHLQRHHSTLSFSSYIANCPSPPGCPHSLVNVHDFTAYKKKSAWLHFLLSTIIPTLQKLSVLHASLTPLLSLSWKLTLIRLSLHYSKTALVKVPHFPHYQFQKPIPLRAAHLASPSSSCTFFL